MTREQSMRACRHGAYTAFGTAALSVGVMAVAMAFGATEGVLGSMNSAEGLFDVAVLVACGVGMLRYSRTAAVVATVVYVLGQIALRVEFSALSSFPLSIAIVWLLGRAVFASFVYHGIERRENPEYRTSSAWIVVAGSIVGAILLGVMGIGLGTMTGVLPATEVRAGADMYEHERETLIGAGVVGASESIEFFYSDAFYSVLEAGNVVTDQRVIRYFEDETGELQVYELRYPDIASVELVQPGGGLDDAVYQVNGHAPDTWLHLALSVEMAGDETLVEAIRARLETESPSTNADEAR